MAEEPERPTDCSDCGACCMGMNLAPIFNPLLPLTMRQALEGVLDGYCAGDDCTPCLWLDRTTGQCIHYELRPDVCREFEVGGEGCMRHRARREEREERCRALIS